MTIQEPDKLNPPPRCRTQCGTFDLDYPRFDIRDIAHSLSLCCRFNGHINRFYSVASHSLIVSKLMEDLKLGDPLEGLLHDATEAYLSDVPAPFKQRLPDWKEIDARLERCARLWFNLPTEKSDGLKKADWLALFMEAYVMLPGSGLDIQDPFTLREEALTLLPSYVYHYYREALLDEPSDVRHEFLTRYEQLRRDRGG
jgi:hypothetical protein